MPAKKTPSRRRYTSARREQQAAQTRSDVLAAAVRLFGAQGWAATTMGAIAAEAGVAVETVYSGFGSKKQLLRLAFDVAVVGDADPIPLAERPEWARMSEGDLEQRMRAGIDLQAGIHVRSAGVWSALREAAASDSEVAGWCNEIESTRRSDLVRALEIVLGRQLDETTVDLVWVVLSPEVYLKLIHERGWSIARYRKHISDVAMRVVDGSSR
jgi:AcrR family transcriptional regulator